MMLETELKPWGNSFGIRISKKDAKKLQLEKGDRVSIELVKKHLAQQDGFGMCKHLPPFSRDRNDTMHNW